MEAQGFVRDASGVFEPPKDGAPGMRLPSELIPRNPADGSAVTTNLRADDTFVEDRQWHISSANYAEFLRRHQTGNVVYLELGVGANTPVIIKYPFWAFTAANSEASYVCVNRSEAFCPAEIADRSICVDADIGQTLKEISALTRSPSERELLND